MHIQHSPMQNRILTALLAVESKHLEKDLELVQMPQGGILCESSCKLHYAYFPTTSVVSMLCLLKDGASTEVAIVGNEGLLGLGFLMGGESPTSQAVVRCAGWGYRLRASVIRDAFMQGGPLMHLLLRYTQALITQTTQTAVCNRHHAIEQQLCRLLLLSLDRLCSDSLMMTQDLMAHLLGVRREGVTEAAGNLQRAGCICYSRGHITVLDRSGLEARVCECYAVVRRELERLLQSMHPENAQLC